VEGAAEGAPKGQAGEEEKGHAPSRSGGLLAR
jgi:hypothetical protein